MVLTLLILLVVSAGVAVYLFVFKKRKPVLPPAPPAPPTPPPIPPRIPPVPPQIPAM